MNDLIDKIPIHWLHTQTYCEYQIYLEKVKGIKAEITEQMKKGKEKHKELEDRIKYQ